MPRRTDIKLSREAIVTAALRVSERGNSGSKAPTGQSLGDELGVDRSAIWRHFRDKDDLLLATADAMMAPVRAGIDTSLPPTERLRWVWDATFEAFLSHPGIGAQLGSRYVAGPNALAITEEIFEALQPLVANPDDAVLEYRAFIDMTLAYAAMVAQHSLLAPARSERDGELTLAAVRTLDPDQYPALAVTGDDLVSVSDTVRARVFDNYAAGLRARSSDQK